MSAWSTSRRAAFLAMLAQFGSTMTCGAMQCQCLADPKESVLQMQRTSMLPVKPAKFSVLREDYVRLNLGLRKLLESCGSTFEIYAVSDDDAEPFIDLRCNVKL